MKKFNQIKKHGDTTKIHLDFQKSSLQLCGIEKYNTYFIPISCTISTVSFCWWQKHTGILIQQVLNAQTKNLDNWGYCPQESRGYNYNFCSWVKQEQHNVNCMDTTAYTKATGLWRPWHLTVEENWEKETFTMIIYKGCGWDIVRLQI